MAENAAARKLASLGRTLYGRQWISRLAPELGCSRETVRRWLIGETLLSSDHAVFDKAIALARSRAAQILAVSDELEIWRDTDRTTRKNETASKPQI